MQYISVLLVEIAAAALIKGAVSFLSVASWLKVNTQEVCFGARGNSYRSFTMQHIGEITSFNLVYLRGSVSCRAVYINRYSYWGCKKEKISKHFSPMTAMRLFSRNILT